LDDDVRHAHLGETGSAVRSIQDDKAPVIMDGCNHGRILEDAIALDAFSQRGGAADVVLFVQHQIAHGDKLQPGYFDFAFWVGHSAFL
jgi:hypothetical protein